RRSSILFCRAACRSACACWRSWSFASRAASAPWCRSRSVALGGDTFFAGSGRVGAIDAAGLIAGDGFAAGRAGALVGMGISLGVGGTETFAGGIARVGRGVAAARIGVIVGLGFSLGVAGVVTFGGGTARVGRGIAAGRVGRAGVGP